ncbi:MAG: hypothetical protein RR052_00990, partial [Oscillospiraceae bacterium]
SVAQLNKTIADLKLDLEDVEKQVVAANESVQRATSQIKGALGGVEEKIGVIQRQVGEYPHTEKKSFFRQSADNEQTTYSANTQETRETVKVKPAKTFNFRYEPKDFQSETEKPSAPRNYKKSGVNGILDSIAKLLDRD